MTQNELYRIRKWLVYFFCTALMVQFGLVCYASGSVLPLPEHLSLQLSQIERITWVSVLSISLNLLVIVVAFYGVHVSLVHSYRSS